MQQPLVSVIIPSYNTPNEYLSASIRSVLEQSYNNFELIIIDDGSNQPVSDMIKEFNSNKIQLIVNEHNSGLPYSLNRGLKASSGKYIFRMDSDDISSPNRLKSQVEYLESHPEVDILSCYADTFGDSCKRYKSATTDGGIKAELLWKNPIIHPTVVFRADAVKKHDIIYSDSEISEDYNLWSKLAFQNKLNFAVLPEALLLYRVHCGQITAKKKSMLLKSEINILKRNLNCIGINLSFNELQNYFNMSRNLYNNELSIKDVVCAMKKIMSLSNEVVSTKQLKMMYKKAIIKYCLRTKNVKALLYYFLI